MSALSVESVRSVGAYHDVLFVCVVGKVRGCGKVIYNAACQLHSSSAAYGRRDMAAIERVPGAGEDCLRQLGRMEEV